MATTFEIQVFDGVAFAAAGDVNLVVYASPARLARSRWLFDRLDESTACSEIPMCGFMVILPTADLPDAETRAENERRLRQLRAKLRRIVTVAIGDSLRLNLIRTVMRGMFLIQGQSQVQFVASTLDEGLRYLYRDATATTPARLDVEATLRAMCARLECAPDAAAAFVRPG